jgi:hypothetical protein
MPANLGAEINDLHAKFPCLANREMFRMEQGDIRCRTGIESRDPRPIREIPGNSEVKVTSSGRRGGPRRGGATQPSRRPRRSIKM